jgi:hypothetical protein
MNEHIERKLELILTALLCIFANQEKIIMATGPELTSALADLTTAVNALETREQNAPPSVLQTDLDPVLAGIQALTTSINNLLTPPAPPAA